MSEDSPKVRDRLALRLSTEYMLRSIDLMTTAVGGDLVKGLIFIAVVQANTQHIIRLLDQGAFGKLVFIHVLSALRIGNQNQRILENKL